MAKSGVLLGETPPKYVFHQQNDGLKLGPRDLYSALVAVGGHLLRFDGRAMMTAQRNPELLTPAEVAAMFRVDPKTVTRWAQSGKLTSIRTLGGHRRYHADEIRRLLNETEQVTFLDRP